MQRGQLRLIVATLAVALLAWVGYRVMETVTDRRPVAVGRALRLLPDAVQRLQDFRRIKFEHGQTVWELTAREAQYFEDARRAVVRGPEMVFYGDGVEKARLAGEEGSLTFDGTDLRSVEMRTGVRVEGGGYVLETDAATYEHDRDAIVAAGAVRIVGQNLKIQGNGMEIAVSSRRLTLHHDVRVIMVNPNGHGS